MKRETKKRRSGRLQQLFPEKYQNEESQRLTMRTQFRGQLAKEAAEGGFRSLTEYVETLFALRGKLGAIKKRSVGARAY